MRYDEMRSDTIRYDQMRSAGLGAWEAPRSLRDRSEIAERGAGSDRYTHCVSRSSAHSSSHGAAPSSTSVKTVRVWVRGEGEGEG